MRIKATIEFDYEVDPEHINIHESVMYQERYRIIETISSTCFDTQNIQIKVEEII